MCGMFRCGMFIKLGSQERGNKCIVQLCMLILAWGQFKKQADQNQIHKRQELTGKQQLLLQYLGLCLKLIMLRKDAWTKQQTSLNSGLKRQDREQIQFIFVYFRFSFSFISGHSVEFFKVTKQHRACYSSSCIHTSLATSPLLKSISAEAWHTTHSEVPQSVFTSKFTNTADDGHSYPQEHPRYWFFGIVHRFPLTVWLDFNLLLLKRWRAGFLIKWQFISN